MRIPSVSVPRGIGAPLLEAFERTTKLFTDAGVEVGRLDLPDTAPVVVGEIPAQPGAPTVLLYSHYDVVPAGDEREWDSPPFEPTERDGAVYARGAADTKSNILMHVGALRAWDGRPPVGIRLCIEGHEEIGSGALLAYPATDPASTAASTEARRPTPCSDRAGDRVAPRRSRRRRGEGPQAQRVGRPGPDRGAVPRARDGPRRAAADRHRRPRLARLVGAGDHGRRHRRAVGGRCRFGTTGRSGW